MTAFNVTIDDTSPQIEWVPSNASVPWDIQNADREAFRGTSHRSVTRDDNMVMEFNGTDIYVYGRECLECGEFIVRLDQESVFAGSTRNRDTRHQTLLWSAHNLSQDVKHTVNITNMGINAGGPVEARNDWLIIDYIVFTQRMPGDVHTTIIDHRHSSVQYTGTGWSRESRPNEGHRTPTVQLTWGTDAQLAIPFNGSSVQVFGAMYWSGGKVDAAIDINNASLFTMPSRNWWPAMAPQVPLYTVTGLDDGPHILRVANHGARNGSVLYFDYIVVNSSIPPPQTSVRWGDIDFPTSSPSPSSGAGKGDAISVGTVSGISVVAGLAVVALVVVIWWFLCRRRRTTPKAEKPKTCRSSLYSVPHAQAQSPDSRDHHRDDIKRPIITIPVSPRSSPHFTPFNYEPKANPRHDLGYAQPSDNVRGDSPSSVPASSASERSAYSFNPPLREPLREHREVRGRPDTLVLEGNVNHPSHSHAPSQSTLSTWIPTPHLYPPPRSASPSSTAPPSTLPSHRPRDLQHASSSSNHSHDRDYRLSLAKDIEGPEIMHDPPPTPAPRYKSGFADHKLPILYDQFGEINPVPALSHSESHSQPQDHVRGYQRHGSPPTSASSSSRGYPTWDESRRHQQLVSDSRRPAGATGADGPDNENGSAESSIAKPSGLASAWHAARARVGRHDSVSRRSGVTAPPDYETAMARKSRLIREREGLGLEEHESATR